MPVNSADQVSFLRSNESQTYVSTDSIFCAHSLAGVSNASFEELLPVKSARDPGA